MSHSTWELDIRGPIDNPGWIKPAKLSCTAEFPSQYLVFRFK
jgi:hypothetical protein